MSKLVQRYECDECGEGYRDESGAKECEKRHREGREQEEREMLWRKIDDRAWALTKEQLERVAAMFDEMGVPK